MFRPIASRGNSIDQRNKLNDSSSPTPPASCFIIGKNLIGKKYCSSYLKILAYQINKKTKNPTTEHCIKERYDQAGNVKTLKIVSNIKVMVNFELSK